MIRDIEIKSYKRWLFGYFPAYFFVFLSFVSLYFVSTYFLTYKTELSLKQWSCEGKISHEGDWDASRQKLALANKLNPWDPDIYFGLGALYEWKASSNLEFNEESRQMRTKAIHNFKEAINNRPTWANAWLNLAQSMLLNRELNDDVFHAIHMGFKYGKWQPEISNKLIWMSIGIWNSIPEELKKIVREQVKIKLENNEPISKFAVLALRYRWFDELSNLVTNQKDKKYLELVKSNPKLLKGAVRNSFGSEKDFVC